MNGIYYSMKSIWKKLKFPSHLNKWGNYLKKPSGELSSYLHIKTEDVEATKIVRKFKGRPCQGRWIFKVTSGNDRGREYIGVSHEIKVGRHPQNNILLRDPKVSRFHAVFYCKGQQMFLEDLKSTNGSKINGELITKRQIFSGDEVKFGETVILITYENH